MDKFLRIVNSVVDGTSSIPLVDKDQRVVKEPNPCLQGVNLLTESGLF